MSPTVNENEIRNKQPWWLGAIFFVIGSGIIIGCYLGEVDEWAPYIVAGIFALLGLVMMLYRYDLHIDLVGRSWGLRKGFVWNVTEDHGDFTAFDSLSFKRERRSSNKSSYTVWVVYLEWVEDKSYKPINLGEWRNEAEAHGQLEQFAKSLDLKMVDMTGDTPVEIDPDDADLSLKDKAQMRREAGEQDGTGLEVLASQPPGGKVNIDVDMDGVHIIYPRGSNKAAGCFFLFFSLFWNAITWTFVVMVLFFPDEIEGDIPLWVAALFMLPFIAVGIGTFLGAMYAFFAQEHLRISPERVVQYWQFLGERSRKELVGDEIEEVKLARDQASTAINIRSDAGIINTGADLKTDEREWLATVVERIVSS